MNLRVLLSNGIDKRLATKKSTLARVKLNFEITGNSRPTDNGNPQKRGLPDTRRYIAPTAAQNNLVILTPELQWLWYNENVKAIPGRTKEFYDKSFFSLTTDDRYVTNGHGSHTCAVYPLGLNLDKGPMWMNLLLTGGSIIELVEPKLYKIMKEWRYPFYVINANSKNIKDFTAGNYPFRWYRPANSVHENGNERISEPFPQYDNKGISPMMLQDTDIAWIEPKYIDILDLRKPIAPAFTVSWAY